MGSRTELTGKQRRFVDAYCQTGNASEAARRAGYKGASNKVSSRLMKRPPIRAAIETRNEELKAASIASAHERRQFWTSAMRGEITGMTVAERLKASELLAKAAGDFVDRREVRSLAMTGTVDLDAIFRKTAKPDSDGERSDAPGPNVIDVAPALPAPNTKPCDPVAAATTVEAPPQQAADPTRAPRLEVVHERADPQREAERRVDDATAIFTRMGL